MLALGEVVAARTQDTELGGAAAQEAQETAAAWAPQTAAGEAANR